MAKVLFSVVREVSRAAQELVRAGGDPLLALTEVESHLRRGDAAEFMAAARGQEPLLLEWWTETFRPATAEERAFCLQVWEALPEECRTVGHLRELTGMVCPRQGPSPRDRGDYVA